MNITNTSEIVGLSSNFADIIINLNNATNTWFFGLLLLFVWLVGVGIISATGYRFIESFTLMSFFIFVLSTIGWAANLISIIWVIFSIIILFIGIVLILFK